MVDDGGRTLSANLIAKASARCFLLRRRALFPGTVVQVGSAIYASAALLESMTQSCVVPATMKLANGKNQMQA
jgi:hypothetical protein